METCLNSCYFFATTRSKCNSSQRNGMTPNLGGLKIDSFHVDEIEKIKKENPKKFQDGECVDFQLDDENDHHPYSHMLVFEQMNDKFNNKITRTFLCK